MNESETGEKFHELRTMMSSALRKQHPEWVKPDGDCPECESYEERLAETLDILAKPKADDGQA